MFILILFLSGGKRVKAGNRQTKECYREHCTNTDKIEHFDNRAVRRRIFGPERKQVTGGLEKPEKITRK